MCVGDGSDTDGRDIQCWSDVDVRWVTDELAQQIKAATTAAAAAASDVDQETDVLIHASLSQTVQLSPLFSLLQINTTTTTSRFNGPLFMTTQLAVAESHLFIHILPLLLLYHRVY